MTRTRLLILLIALNLALSSFLILSAMLKLFDLATFTTSLTAHHLIPPALIPTGSVLIPASELGLGLISLIWLCESCSRQKGLRVLTLSFGLLTLYSTALVVFPPPVPAPCGCGFAQGPVESWTLPAIRNLALTSLPVLTALLTPIHASRSRA